MSLHDAYARRTPFEIAFPDRSVVEQLSADVSEEARRRGLDDTLVEAFVTTVAAGDVVREMRGPDAPPESSYPLATLLYQSVHFLRAGCPLFLVDTAVTRVLAVERWPRPESGAAVERAAPEPPFPAGYLQLPQHLVWAEGGGSEGPEGGAGDAAGGTGGRGPESLDGFFWTASAAGALHVLPVSGVRPDRPGFAALPLPAAPLADSGLWLNARVRGAGADFASTLPGGEIDRLHAVRTAGEVLKLLARFFALVSGASDGRPPRVRLEPRPTPGGPLESAAGSPHPSALPYTRVSADG